jgi:hypothetical protein
MLVGGGEGLGRHVQHAANLGFSPREVLVVEKNRATYESLLREAPRHGIPPKHVWWGYWGPVVRELRRRGHRVAREDFDGVWGFDRSRPVLDEMLASGTPGSLTVALRGKMSPEQAAKADRYGLSRRLTTSTKEYTVMNVSVLGVMLGPDGREARGDGRTAGFALGRRYTLGEHRGRVYPEPLEPQAASREVSVGDVAVPPEGYSITVAASEPYSVPVPRGRGEAMGLYPATTRAAIRFASPPPAGAMLGWKGKTLTNVRRPHFGWEEYVGASMEEVLGPRYDRGSNPQGKWDMLPYLGVKKNHMLTVVVRP